MQNFHWNIQTQVFFGRGQIAQLGAATAECGKKALIVYGGGSVKRSGIFDAATEQLKAHGVSYAELAGVTPNPRLDTVKKGVAVCREEGVDVILALGGGSVIDCAKVIAGSVHYPGDPWDLVSGKHPYPDDFLPVIAVVTLAATGSEMDHIAVISNWETNEKIGTRHPQMRPRYAIMDPCYTFSVSRYQTASGTADIFAHALENYLNPKGRESYILDGFAASVMRTCVEYGPKALENPEDYEARAQLMLASSHAINGLLSLGKDHAWTAHGLEHQLSAYYDVTHGAGLAVVIPAWLEYVLNEETAPKLRQLAVQVFQITPTGNDVQDAKTGIAKMRNFFFEVLGLPENLRGLGITEQDKFAEMAQKAATGSRMVFVPITQEDAMEIYKACF